MLRLQTGSPTALTRISLAIKTNKAQKLQYQPRLLVLLADRKADGSFHSLKRAPNWAPTWTKNWLSAYKPTKNWIQPLGHSVRISIEKAKNNCPELFNISREPGLVEWVFCKNSQHVIGAEMPYREDWMFGHPQLNSVGGRRALSLVKDMHMDIVGHRRGHVNVYLSAAGSLAVLSANRVPHRLWSISTES